MMKRVNAGTVVERRETNGFELGREQATAGVEGKGPSARDGRGMSLKRSRGQSDGSYKGGTSSAAGGGLKVPKRARVVKGLGC